MEKYIEKLAVLLLRLYDKLIEIPKDKLLHIVVAALVTAILKLFLPFIAVFLIMTLIFFSKEIYDRVSGYGTYEIKDIIADYVGFIIGII